MNTFENVHLNCTPGTTPFFQVSKYASAVIVLFCESYIDVWGLYCRGGYVCHKKSCSADGCVWSELGGDVSWRTWGYMPASGTEVAGCFVQADARRATDADLFARALATQACRQRDRLNPGGCPVQVYCVTQSKRYWRHLPTVTITLVCYCCVAYYCSSMA